MSILEKIRNHTGLLLGVVGGALILFIVQSALTSGTSLFGTNDNAVGKVYGQDVLMDEFKERYDLYEKNQQNQQQQNQSPDELKQQIVNQAWQSIVTDKINKREYEALGLAVSDEEIYELMIGNPHQMVLQQIKDPKTGQIIPQYAKPDGTLDVAKWNKFVVDLNTVQKDLKPEEQEQAAKQRKQWADFEKSIVDMRLNEKYQALIKKGLYVSSKHAEYENKNQNSKFNVQFVAKNYAEVADSTIAVTDDEIQKYYNDHLYQYQNEKTSRKIDYVLFNAVASPEDVIAIKADLEDITKNFKALEPGKADDSSFVAQEAEAGNGSGIVKIKAKDVSPMMDSTIKTAAPGFITVPYIEAGLYKISKLMNRSLVNDSGKVRHILIGFNKMLPDGNQVPRDPAAAKKTADSVVEVLKKGGNFNDLVAKLSDDGGKKAPNPQPTPQNPNPDTVNVKGRNGVYGWVKPGDGYVPEFLDFAITGKKGEIKSVKTQFGYHVMEIMDASSSKVELLTIGTIGRVIEPSQKTMSKVTGDANKFAGENNTKEKFDKAVTDQGLNKRFIDELEENEYKIPGIDSPKDIVVWAYNAKEGDVSEVFTFNSKINLVAKLVEIKNKGVKALAHCKDEVKTKVIQEKKAAKFVDEFNKNAGGTISALATKMKLQVNTADSLVFASYNVPGAGQEFEVLGAASGLKVNTVSKPIIGASGVYVITVTGQKIATVKDIKTARKTSTSILQNRTYEVAEALKKLADPEQHTNKANL